MAQEAGRPHRARRTAVRNLDRQSGRGDPRALGRRPEGNQSHRGADRADPDCGRRDRCVRAPLLPRRLPLRRPPQRRKRFPRRPRLRPRPLRLPFRRPRQLPWQPPPAPRPQLPCRPCCARQWPKDSQLAAGPEACQRTQRGPRIDGRKRRGRTHQQERYSRRGESGGSEACGPCALLRRSAATAVLPPLRLRPPDRGRRGASGARKCRPARADLFRQL